MHLDPGSPCRPDRRSRVPQPLNRGRNVLRRAHDDIDVDHWLRGETRNRGAADVLDRDSDLAGRAPHRLGDLPEEHRPLHVVVTDDDRKDHGSCAGEDLIDRLLGCLI